MKFNEIIQTIKDVGFWISIVLIAIIFIISIIGYIYHGIRYGEWSKPFYGN